MGPIEGPLTMNDRKMLGTGAAGAVVMGLCCFTPLLVVSMGALGLTALVGWWLDLLLFPALAGFLFMTGLALHRMAKRRRGNA